MTNETFSKVNEQTEKMFMGPTRDYAKLPMDYAEKMIEAKMEAAKTDTEIGMKQARAGSENKEREDLKDQAEEKQKVAKEMSEGVKGCRGYTANSTRDRGGGRRREEGGKNEARRRGATSSCSG